MKKLIRDKYEDIIEPSKLEKSEDTVEKFYLLNEKINEELVELRETVFNDVEEFADVVEVLMAMAKFQGINEADIQEAREKKNNSKGKFNNFLILKDI